MATFTPRPPKPTSGELAIAYLSRLAGWLDQLVNWLNVSPGNRPHTILIRTTSAISGRSGSTLGSGTAMVLKRDGTTLVDSDTSVTIYNVASSAASSGKYGEAHLVNGVYVLGPLECG